MKESNPAYVLTQDTRAIFDRVFPDGQISNEELNAIDEYFECIAQNITDGFPDMSVLPFQEIDIQTQLAAKVREELNKNPQACCIILDRYLLPDIEQEFPERFMRFSITRTGDGGKTPRPGDPTFADQMQTLMETTPDLANRPVILVDDGIFSGGTIKDALDKFTAFGIPLRIQSIIGFVGQKRNDEPLDGVSPVILQPIESLYDWIDIRDFGPFGGKILKSSKNNRVATSVPYLYPWSYGESASLNTSPSLFSISKNLIQAIKNLVINFEQQNATLKFRDLIKRGFALPVSVTRMPVPISINDRVADYLDRCITVIEEEQVRKVFVFDMDGTLYRLDGMNNGFKGSSLEARTRDNAIQYIKDKELCTTNDAEAIYTEGVNDSIGLSRYLGQRYGVSRETYFDTVWNINPQGIIQPYTTSSEVMRNLSATGAKLILLTSAPKVWARKVLAYLGVADLFEIIFTGEQFGKKDEIFDLLAQWYRPENVCSIGDQEQTDIIPAQNKGFRTVLIGSDADFGILVKDV